MAGRVRDFSRAHPSADANYAPALARLEDRIARMKTLAKQQEGGFLAKKAFRTLAGQMLDQAEPVREVLGKRSSG
jgi:hypothetical protein